MPPTGFHRPVLVAVVVGGLTWGAAFAMPVEFQTVEIGAPREASLPVEPGRAANFEWVVPVFVARGSPDELRVWTAFREVTSRDAGRAAQADVEMTLNGARAYKFVYLGSVPHEVGFRVLPPHSEADWSALRPGDNELRFYVNFSMPPGSYEQVGRVAVSAGPVYLSTLSADRDRDGIPDNDQPVPWLPTYVLALGGGAAAGALTWVLLRRRGRSS